MIAALKRAWLSLFFLGVALLLFLLTLQLSPIARLVPLTVAVPALVLLLLQSCLDLFPRMSGLVARFDRLRLDRVEAMKTRAAGGRARESESLGRVLAWFAGAPVLVVLLGFSPAVLVYTSVFLRWRSGESWVLSVALGAAVSLAVALLLLFATGQPVGQGVLPGWLR